MNGAAKHRVPRRGTSMAGSRRNAAPHQTLGSCRVARQHSSPFRRPTPGPLITAAASYSARTSSSDSSSFLSLFTASSSSNPARTDDSKSRFNLSVVHQSSLTFQPLFNHRCRQPRRLALILNGHCAVSLRSKRTRYDDCSKRATATRHITISDRSEMSEIAALPRVKKKLSTLMTSFTREDCAKPILCLAPLHSFITGRTSATRSPAARNPIPW